jgi:PAS domain S-box-containing protein
MLDTVSSPSPATPEPGAGAPRVSARPATPSARPIRAYLALLTAVAALPLAALAVRAGMEAYRLEQRQGELAAMRLAEATSASTVQLLTNARSVLEGVAKADVADLFDTSRCGVHLATARRLAPFLSNFITVDTTGRIRCSAVPPSPQSQLDVSAREWFRAIRAGETFAVGAPVVGAITAGWVVGLAVPVRAPDGTLRGVVGGSLPLVRFQEVLAGAPAAPDELMTISDTARRVIARSRDPEEWVGRQLTRDTTPGTPLGAGRALVRGRDSDGTQRQWASVTVPTIGWTVYAGVPLARVLEPARAKLVQYALLGFLVLASALALAWAIERNISRSLQRVVEAARDASDGDASWPEGGGPAEVQALAGQLRESFALRDQADAAERRTRAQYQAIVDHAVFGIAVVGATGRFEQVNPALLAMLGCADARELVAREDSSVFVTVADRDALRERLQRDGTVRDVETEWRCADGSVIVVRLGGRLVREGRGEKDGQATSGYELFVEDITSQRALEQALNQSQKMEAVGRLAGGIAHDFNNLLTVIGGNASLLLADEPSDASRAELREIAEAAERARLLTRQLLGFSRRAPAVPRALDVNEVITGLGATLLRLIGEHIEVHTTLAADLAPVLMDQGQLEQVLVNLAVNARDAMPGGGTLHLSTWAAALPPAEAADREAPGGWVVISAQDTGHGIAPAVRERIFEPFFTTKPTGEGTGLGLAVSYANVTAAGGCLTVTSRPGDGARFEVWLPAAPNRVPAARTAPGDTGTVRGGTESVLVVEDEDALRRLIVRTLGDAGYTITVAEDGQAAIDRLAAPGARFDLVVTDVVMPRRSGIDVARAAQACEPAVPVLLMTGYPADLPIWEAIGGETDRLLQKPFSPGDLLARIRRLIDRALSDRASGPVLP